MIRNELNSPTLRWLDEKSRWDTLVDIFKEIKLLTGAILYTGNDLKLQVKVLERFLVSSPKFSTLTTNEIRHAFYLNSQGEYPEIYKHYNKELNAEFMGSVLLAYLAYKESIYTRVDVKGLIDPPAPAPDFIRPAVEEYQQFIQQDYDRYRDGNHEFIFYSPSKYQVLRQCGLIEIYSRGYFNKQYLYAMADRYRYAHSRPKHPGDRDEETKIAQVRTIYDKYEASGMYPVAEHRVIVHLLRKKLYLRFFKIIASCGINNIFTDIDYRK